MPKKYRRETLTTIRCANCDTIKERYDPPSKPKQILNFCCRDCVVEYRKKNGFSKESDPLVYKKKGYHSVAYSARKPKGCPHKTGLDGHPLKWCEQCPGEKCTYFKDINQSKREI